MGMTKWVFLAVRSRLPLAIGLITALTAILWIAIPAGAASLTTEMVSVSSGGEQGNGDSFPSTGPTSISPNGQFVVFASSADNLVAGDTNEHFDVFRRDRSSGQTVRVSVTSSGQQGNGDSGFSGTFSISADGNLVAFDSETSNLVPGDTNRLPDVFVHDVATGETTRVSVTSSGRQAQGESFGPAISDDGRLVLFNSGARLLPEDTNRRLDVYAHDLVTGQIRLVSVSSTGQLGNDDSFVEGTPSADDRLVAFTSFASNLVPADTNDALDSLVHDLATGLTTRVSVSSSGQQGDSDSFQAHISADGRFVAFSSDADNLVRHDTNGFIDAFVRDLKTGNTSLVSKSSAGDEGNEISCCSKGISSDGRFVAYRSFASNLVSGDTNEGYDVFLFDRTNGQTVLASVSATGEQGVYSDPLGGSYNAAISEDGAWVLFGSIATNFPPGGDTNGPENGDTFVRGPFGSLQGLSATGPTRISTTARSSSPGGAARCRRPSSLERYLSRLPAAERPACAM